MGKSQLYTDILKAKGIDDPQYGYVNWSFEACKKDQDCKKELAWESMLDLENLKTPSGTRAVKNTFKRQKNREIAPKKKKLKNEIKQLREKRVKLNQEIKLVDQDIKSRKRNLEEKATRDFDTWKKINLSNVNTTKFANVLQEAVDTENARDEMFKQNKQYYLNLARDTQKILSQKPASDVPEYEQWINQIRNSELSEGLTYIKNGKIDHKKIEQKAEQNTDIAMTRFLSKTVSKVALVLDKRPDCDEFTAKLNPSQNTVFDGIVKAKCKNGDQFHVKNELIFVQPYFKPSIGTVVTGHVKYPTHFINVVKDGEPVENPVDEKWMVTKFVCKKD